MGWVDLHSHVLPGIDDGPSSEADSLAMAALAARSGTSVLAATPHVRADWPDVHPREIAGRVELLNERLAERGVQIEIVPGGEVALIEAFELPVEELRLVTLGANGRDLLVETPHGPLPGTFDRLVDAVARRGFRVLLAHPEHSVDFQRDPGRLEALVDAGVLIQLTAGSFASGRRTPWRRAAVEILRNGWVHVLASDAHSASWRPPDLGEGLRAAAAAVPEAAGEIEWLARDAPAAVLAGTALPPRPARPAPPARRGLLGRLRG